MCASPQTAFKYRIERYAFDVWECSACASQFQYPLPKDAYAFYDEGYYTGTAGFHYQDEREKERYHNFVHDARLNRIQEFLSAGRSKILDVGCAFGALVRAAERHGFEAYGLDVSAFAVREGNKISEEAKNLVRFFQGDLLHLPRGAKKIFAPRSFAAVTLIEVAEHLTKPRAAFETTYNLLHEGGVLVVQTANFEGWQARSAGSNYHYYLPGHLVYYTATGLKKMLAEIGFREFREFFPVDFSLWAKWRKAWGDVSKAGDMGRFVKMSLYHLKSKFKWQGKPLTSSYVLYAIK
ncbi:MAG TPA: class I SAM-dependent methyltransferase [Turneriella sp.]|nr:class I SAM-dependent methyltransferase [Turneriella sp.]